MGYKYIVNLSAKDISNVKLNFDNIIEKDYAKWSNKLIIRTPFSQEEQTAFDTFKPEIEVKEREFENCCCSLTFCIKKHSTSALWALKVDDCMESLTQEILDSLFKKDPESNLELVSEAEFTSRGYVL